MDITYTFLLPILQVFFNLTHSYGWAIILLTCLIRALVWPLQTASTRSMQRMSLLQPELKKIQERYKDNPEVLSRKSMEFMSKNKMNPLGGCLPMLVQLPVLIALFATFTGPPFQDKDIPVKITLAKQDAKDVKVVQNPNSSATAPYIGENGKSAKFSVQPGDETFVWGKEKGETNGEPPTIDFRVNTVEGTAPTDFKPLWKIQNDPNGAKIDPHTGQAVFPKEADAITVAATFPGTNVEPIEIPIKVEAQPEKEGGGGPFNMFGGGGNKDAFRSKTEATTEQRTITVDGKQVTVAVMPGPSTVVANRGGVVFELKPINGSLEGLHPEWRILKDPNAATIDENGHAVFPSPGEVTVAAVIPGTAKNESFLFISSIGKQAKGMEMFEPKNWDVLALLIAFAVTMYVSSMLMSPSSSATSTMDPEQAAIQKQTQQTMPIMVTAMFFFYALPAGVFLYLVVSNVLQTFQSWLIYRTPPPPLVDVMGDDNDEGGSAASGGTIIDVGGGDGSDAGSKIQIPKQKQGKKKEA